MPFTLAHPAIVVPLAKHRSRAFSLMALAVGSMSPDFEYFVWLEPRRTIGHDILGVPLLCMPTGLLVLWLFDRIVKRPLIAIAPRPLRARLSRCWAFVPLWPASKLARVLISLAIGAYSHLFWDAFTHADGWFVQRLPVLGDRVTILSGRALALHVVLQHASTIIGLTLIAIWSCLWLRKQPVDAFARSPNLSALAAAVAWIALTLVPAALGVWFTVGIAHGNAESRIADTVIATIAAWCCVALIFGVIATVYRRAESPA